MAIREWLRAAGELGVDRIALAATDGTGERQYSLALAEGDRVRLFTRLTASFQDTGTHGNIGRNGSVLEVAAIQDDGLMLRTQAGREGFVPWQSLRDDKGRVQLAYGEALTTYTSQGSTVTEHIHAMPSGSRMVTAFGAYTSGSRHREQSFIVISEAAERSEIAGRRPLGDRREIGPADILANVTRNLSRQHEKESALFMMHRAANLRRGTIRAVQAALEPMEKRAAAPEPQSELANRLQERRLIRALAERLPGLAERLRRHGDTIAQVARQAATLVERMAEIARRRRANYRAQENYWKSVSKRASRGASDKAQAQSERRSRRR